MSATALSRWQRLGWPTTRAEAWRNFSTKPLQGLALDAGVTPGAPISEATLAALPSPRVVLVDGRRAPALDDLAALPPGVEVGDALGAAAAATATGIVPDDGALEALNEALATGGVHIAVRAGTDGGALHVVHLVSGAGVAHVRTTVTLAAGASLTLGQHHLGASRDEYLVNAVTALDLGAGAMLALGKRVAEGPGGNHLDAVHAHVAAGATLATFTLSLAGARVRTGVDVTLAGEGASAAVDGLYLGAGRDKLDHVTRITHAVARTRSSQSWAGVLDERAEGGFQGVIHIARDAAQCATRQLTRTLLLSNDAEAHAKPELHIDCDDVVEASHGATVGQLDAMEQFYLESRGIAPADARRMLIRAFVDKQLALAPAALKAVLAAAVDARLGGRGAVDDLELHDV